jgi:hypothetical protein
MSTELNADVIKSPVLSDRYNDHIVRQWNRKKNFIMDNSDNETTLVHVMKTTTWNEDVLQKGELPSEDGEQ